MLCSGGPAGISARVKSGVDLLLHLSAQARLDELP